MIFHHFSVFSSVSWCSERFVRFKSLSTFSTRNSLSVQLLHSNQKRSLLFEYYSLKIWFRHDRNVFFLWSFFLIFPHTRNFWVELSWASGARASLYRLFIRVLKHFTMIPVLKTDIFWRRIEEVFFNVEKFKMWKCWWATLLNWNELFDNLDAFNKFLIWV